MSLLDLVGIVLITLCVYAIGTGAPLRIRLEVCFDDPMLISLSTRLPAVSVSLLVATAAASQPEPSPDGARMDIAHLIPAHLGEWQEAGDPAIYDQKTIFRYMDGAAEVYLSFAFQELLVSRYTGPGEDEVTVELYDMGNPADAFGIFSRNRQGDDAGIGQGSEYRSGYLVFWQDRYFATLFAAQESAESRRFIFELAREITGAIGQEGSLPEIVSLLPREDLVETSIRYFHLHTDLNQHYFISDDNILALGPDIEAVIANYEREGERKDRPSAKRSGEFVYLLIVRYPDDRAAGAAFAAYIDAFMPEAKETGIVELEDGYWSAASLAGNHIIAVYDAPAAERARGLLAAARSRTEEALK